MKDFVNTLFGIFIMLFLLCCTDVLRASDTTNIKAMDENGSKCDQNGDSIRKILNQITVESEMNRPSFDRLLVCFMHYERQKNAKFFSKEGDDKLFYDKVLILSEKSKGDINSLRFLIKLSLIIKRNVEVSEYLSEIVPDLALQNTEGFVKVYKELSSKERGLLISKLEYFKGPAEFKKFNSNLELVDNDLSSVAQEIKVRVNEHLMQ